MGAVVDASPLGLIDKPENLDLVNWLLNNIPAGYSMMDVQQAILLLVDDNPPTPSANATALANAAIVNGEGFVPGCGQYYLVVVAPTLPSGGPGQTIIIVLQKDPCPPPGRILVQKQTLPDNAPAQSFSFDPSWGADFALSNGGSTDSGLLPPGVYSVAELMPLPAGWSFSGVSCSDGSNPAAIGVSEGEVVTCIFTNVYRDPGRAHLTIVKRTLPLNASDSTVFDFSAGPLGTFQLGDDGAQSFEVDAGEYSVAETVPANWVFESVACVDAAGQAVPDGDLTGAVTVSLSIGQHVTCTFVNRQTGTGGPEGSLTIIKQTVPPGGTGFDFDAGSLGTFSLDDDGSVTFGELEAGAYTVAEDDPGGQWAFAQVECTALDWQQSGASVTVNLAEGEAAVCTFTNGQLPYTGSRPLMLPLLIAGLWALLMGLGMVEWFSTTRARV